MNLGNCCFKLFLVPYLNPFFLAKCITSHPIHHKLFPNVYCWITLFIAQYKSHMCSAANGAVPISCHWEVAHVFCFCYFKHKVTNNELLCGLWLSERAERQNASHISSGMVMCVCVWEKIASSVRASLESASTSGEISICSA